MLVQISFSSRKTIAEFQLVLSMEIESTKWRIQNMLPVKDNTPPDLKVFWKLYHESLEYYFDITQLYNTITFDLIDTTIEVLFTSLESWNELLNAVQVYSESYTNLSDIHFINTERTEDQ